jgi:hypothetical protein
MLFQVLKLISEGWTGQALVAKGCDFRALDRALLG